MFSEPKRIIDELEGILTGSPIDATEFEVLTVAVEENYKGNITVGAKANKINEASNEMENNIK